MGVYVQGLREGDWFVMTTKGRVLRSLTYSNGHIDPIHSFVDRSVEYSIDQESLKLIAGCLPATNIWIS